MTETVLRLQKVRLRYAPSTDLAQFRFSDADGNVAAIEMRRADVPRILLMLQAQAGSLPSEAVDQPGRVMEITNLSAAIAENGSPVLTIETQSLPGLSFAISPDQVEAVAAWLENCLSALQGRRPGIQ